MKKRLMAIVFAGIIATSALAGCGSGDEKMIQYKELGITQMNSGDYSGAAQSFTAALSQKKRMGAQEMDISYYKALALYKAGRVSEAMDEYNDLIDHDKKNWELYYLRGDIQLHEGDTEAALADYDKAVKYNKKDIALYVHIYESLMGAGCEGDAQTYLDQVLNMKPSKAEDYCNIGEVYFFSGDYEKAKEYLQEALDDDYERAMLVLGRVYAAEGNDAQAKELFEKYMDNNPEDAIALNELGEIAMKAGKYEEAVTYLEKAIDVTDSGIEQKIYKNLIAAYEYVGDFRQAYEDARVYLSYWSDAEVEREYTFLKTRINGEVEVEETTDSKQGTDEITGTIEF